MTEFEHTLQRRDGGHMTISVKADSLTLTIPPPVTASEKEAMDGLKSLAEALQRNEKGSNIQSKDGAVSLTINTPKGRDNPLAMVAVSSLETHDVVKPGESKRFETALHAAEQQQPQLAQKSTDPVSKEISDIQKAAAAIGNAMRSVVTPSEPSVAVASQSLPGKSESRTLG